VRLNPSPVLLEPEATFSVNQGLLDARAWEGGGVPDEPDGFHAYVVARQDDLLRLARMLTADWASAEDLVQVSLERVWPRWNRIVRDGDPDAYVRRVLVNAHVKSGRRRWRGELPFADVPDRLSGDAFDDADLRQTVQALLPSLPPRQRVVLVLRFYVDLTETAVADLLGCSVGTVKSQTAKGLRNLRVECERRAVTR
jgi:RNA polymerase sigma-70 factor (sigma-E family)